VPNFQSIITIVTVSLLDVATPSSGIKGNSLHSAWTESQITRKVGLKRHAVKWLGARFSRCFSFAAGVIPRHCSPVRIYTCGAFWLLFLLVSVRPEASRGSSFS